MCVACKSPGLGLSLPVACSIWWAGDWQRAGQGWVIVNSGKCGGGRDELAVWWCSCGERACRDMYWNDVHKPPCGRSCAVGVLGVFGSADGNNREGLELGRIVRLFASLWRRLRSDWRYFRRYGVHRDVQLASHHLAYCSFHMKTCVRNTVWSKEVARPIMPYYVYYGDQRALHSHCLHCWPTTATGHFHVVLFSPDIALLLLWYDVTQGGKGTGVRGSNRRPVARSLSLAASILITSTHYSPAFPAICSQIAETQ